MKTSPAVLLTGLVLFAFACGSSRVSVGAEDDALGKVVTLGVTGILPSQDSGNANLLIAQRAKLLQPATLQTLSFYVEAAAGHLVLGVYDATGLEGGPGALLAQTGTFTPVAGWNRASVTTPVTLPAGIYWLAYLPDDDGLAFRKGAVADGVTASRFYAYPFGALPSAFSSSPSAANAQWSFYGTLKIVPPAPDAGNTSLDTTPPSVPAGLVVSGVAQTGVSLSWAASTDNVGVAGYQVWTNGSQVATPSGTSYSFAGLTCGTGYALGVAAYDAAGNVSVVTSLNVTTAACSTSGITMGATSILPADDDGNANLMVAQQATLAQAATLQSMSFYVTVSAGSLILGIYDATGPSRGPGHLLAQTQAFTPTTGWNTANVTTPVTLAAGAYWLAYLPSDNNLAFKKQELASGVPSSLYYAYSFGAMPSTFAASADTASADWSLYATLTATPGGPPPPPPPPHASTSATLGFNGIGTPGDFLTYFPASNVDDYAVFLAANPESNGENSAIIVEAHAHNVKAFGYYNLQDDANYSESVCYGVCYSQALANGWLALYGGNPMSQAATGFPNVYTADIGNSAYVNAWCDNVINEVKSLGYDGVIMDNVMENGGYWTVGHHWPDKYPTQQSWADAYVAALQIVHQRFHAAGLLVAGNEITWGDINYRFGTSDRAWAARITPYLDVVSFESLLIDGGGNIYGTDNDATGVTDRMGEQRDVEAAGAGFWTGLYSAQYSGNPNVGNGQRFRYTKGAWMLNWSGNNNSAFVGPNSSDIAQGNYSATDSNFDFNIGTPVDPVGGEAVGNAFERAYSGGWVLWNPSGSSVVINVGSGPYTNQAGQTGISGNVTVAAHDAVFLQKQ